LRRSRREAVRLRQFQNNGGVWPTLSGPRKTMPSTKRSGKVRAFLPSSSASLPSALMPAATPALAFCLTTLARPGMARADALDAGDRHLQFAFETARGAQAQRARGARDQIALLDTRLRDLDMAPGGLELAKAHRPRFRCQILQPAHQRVHIGVEGIGKQRMQAADRALVDLHDAFDHRR